jgi:glucose-6-phosphate 1-dehydrogenase
MDAPARVAGEELHAERLKVLRSLRPVRPEDAVLGQYEGYDDEEGVAAGSRTETYAAMRVAVDSWRWSDVPCYLRTGKRLEHKVAEIAVAFRPSPHVPFFGADGWAGANRLVIGIQPGEKVQLHVTGKVPGAKLELAKVQLDFDAGEAAERDAPGAYERLLGDAVAGDTTLFTTSAEVEAQWAAVDVLLADPPEPARYAPGSAGPEAADELPGRDGRRWRPLG